MTGRFVAVVGPSGVGKDSLIAALAEADPSLYRVRRVITRPADAGGEDHEAVTPALFAARAAGGDFALQWDAHGLGYGIPATVRVPLAQGRDVLANLSRAALARAAAIFDPLVVLHLTARPEIRAARLAARGREGRDDISRRLARPGAPFPQGVTVIEIDNSGDLGAAVAAALLALDPQGAVGSLG